MTAPLSDKAARAVEAWLEERGLVVVPKQMTPFMQDMALAEHGQGINRDLEVMAIWDTTTEAAPTADTKGLAQAVLDVVLELDT